MTQTSLEDAEVTRRERQSELERSKGAAERNRAGQFDTPTQLALEMAELGNSYLVPGNVRFMDPAFGTGVFYYAARRTLDKRITSAVGYELDSTVATAAESLWSEFGI